MAEYTFPVNVKDSSMKRNYTINVNVKWNVAQVKQEIATKSGLRCDQFKLVFAGAELKEYMTLKSIGVQSASTLHCVQATNVQMQQSTPDTAVLNEVNLGDAAESTTSSSVKVEQKTYFYVFCKKPCSGMAPGKLRVRCFQCKDTSFVLAQGPSNWKDVLTPQRLRGRCNNVDCRGDVAEFYFKCASHPTVNDETSVPLHMIRSNNVGVECITCCTVTPNVVVFDCDVGHSMCIRCFIEYMKSALNNRGFKNHPQHGYTILCPNNCDGSELKEIHHFRLMGKEDYERYHSFGTEELFLRQMGGMFCPAPKCCNGLIPDPGQRHIKCNECGFEFCSECKRQYHGGQCTATTDIQQAAHGENPNHFNQNVNRAGWEAASERCIREISKKCPHCKVAIQKNEGCNHMTCTMCGFEFCWLCMTRWNGDCQDDHWFS